jgi:hypothetical protein
VAKLSSKYSYSPKEILEATEDFKKGLLTGKLKYSQIQDDFIVLLELKYPELKGSKFLREWDELISSAKPKKKTMFGQWMEIAREEKKPKTVEIDSWKAGRARGVTIWSADKSNHIADFTVGDIKDGVHIRDLNTARKIALKFIKRKGWKIRDASDDKYYLPRVVKTEDKEHPDQRLADYWREYRGQWPDLTFEQALRFFSRPRDNVNSVKADGEQEVLHYARSGIPMVGFDAKTHQSMRNKKVKCLMSNNGSHLYFNNPITVAFEKWCKEHGYKEVTLFGECFGMHQGNMLPFPPRPPGTSNNIILGSDWNAWKKYIKFWVFDVYKIDDKVYFPKVKYKFRLQKSKEMFGMAEVAEMRIVRNPSKYQNGRILKEISRTVNIGATKRLSEDKSADSVILEAKKWLYSGFSISYYRPDDYLFIFRRVADVFSKTPEFARQSFGFSDLFLVADKGQKGRYTIIPIPMKISARQERLKDNIDKKPWIYRLRKHHRVKHPALRAFVRMVKTETEYSDRRIKMVRTKARKVYRLVLVKHKKAKAPKIVDKIAEPVATSTKPQEVKGEVKA